MTVAAAVVVEFAFALVIAPVDNVVSAAVVIAENFKLKKKTKHKNLGKFEIDSKTS